MKTLTFWRSKRFWQILGLNSLIIIGLFVLLTFTSQKLLNDYAETNYKNMMNGSTIRLNSQVTNMIQELNYIGENIQKDSGANSTTEEEMVRYLKEIATFASLIDGGSVVDVDGTVLAHYPEHYSLTNTQSNTFSDEEDISFKKFTNSSGNKLMQVTVPIFKDDKVYRNYKLIIDVARNPMFQTLFSTLEFTKNSYVAVYDSDGKSIFEHNKLDSQISISSFQINRQMLTDMSPGFKQVYYQANQEDKSYFVSQQLISGLNWSVLMAIPEEEINIASQELNKVLIPVFLILSIILFFTITIMMHRNLQPINRLFHAVEKVSEGDYTHRIKQVDPTSDIGTISAKFNVMVHELEKYRTDVKQKTVELKQQKNFLNRIINFNPSAIYTMNWEGKFTLINKEFASLYSLTPDDIIGKKEQDFNPNAEEAWRYLKVNREIMMTNEAKETEDYLIDHNGDKRWFHIGKVPIVGNIGEQLQLLCVATEITEMKKQEELIKYQAFHDELTKLPNRKLFIETIDSEISYAQEHDTKIALFFLDLDRFKYINDTFGHDAGDSLLKTVGQRLQSILKDADKVFRFGGDEFTILATQLNDKQEAADIAKEILSILTKPYQFNEHRFIITASLGISIYPIDATGVNALTKYADTAMYQSKQQGKNTFRFYTEDMENEVAEKLKLEMDLYQANERNELFMHYQPIINTNSGKMTGVEALLRWEHKELGLITPAEFIPIAEETGLIHEIGESALRIACMQMKKWNDKLDKPLFLSVNLSPVQLQDQEIVTKICKILEETNFNPELLTLEITESTIMKNKNKEIRLIKQLRKLGCKIAIDDFGTGYSSLNVIKHLPIDTLKIDRSFIQNLLIDEIDDAVLTAVFEMAAKLKLIVIAEGIETEEQFEYVKQKHCHYVQGFLFSQPLEAEQIDIFRNDNQ
ncbi:MULTISPECIES: EAL domain-containing protein [Paraliobacillus]|uniref:bifunctional diguanylate cyclase/phosphodiesterase n=1 Tax=Paraliobacillus TaxID=200903 RepID=UPI000DD4D964|nr:MULTISPECIES: EAL domain-containing protein [Paraliobacillus]